MHLIDIARGGAAIPLVDLAAFKDLARDMQDLLGRFGLLDPPVDGSFGQISRWALREAVKALRLPEKSQVDTELATALLAADPNKLFGLKPKTDFAGKIAKYMAVRGLWLSRHPECVNIIYVEGSDVDGTANPNTPNQFNDVRLLLRVAQPSGVPEIVDAWGATTEPGKFYTEVQPLNPAGAARIAFGQYKAWTVGLHPSGTSSSRHEALIQAAEVTVYRDANRDYQRTGDRPDTGMFGINQHWGYDLPQTDIRNASAGCLVGRLKTGHVAFMKGVKADARFRESNGYRFLTTVMDRRELG